MRVRNVFAGISAPVVALILATAASPANAAAVPLGNLFDDDASATLAAAIASDTFGAAAGTGDLGVEVVQLGSLGSPVVIAPGVSFNFSTAGGDAGAFSSVLNDAAYSNGSSFGSIRTTGVQMGTYGNAKVEDGIGMHANALITFNLDELRAAGLGTDPLSFTGEGGLNDDVGSGTARAVVVVSDASGVIAGYINGQQVAVGSSGGVFSFTGTIPAQLSGRQTALFDVALPAGAKFLTLATTSGPDGNSGDQTVFSAANLNTVPEPASFSLLGCGLAALLIRRDRSGR